MPRKLLNRLRLAAILLISVSGAAAAFADYDGRLPISSAKPLELQGAVPDYVWQFKKKNGGAFVIYWDFLLDTPRYISPRTRLGIATKVAQHANDKELYLLGSARRFIDDNWEFFGASFDDLVDPQINTVPGGWLLAFTQAAHGVPVRGSSFRMLIRQDGTLGFIKCFLLRRWPDMVPQFADVQAAIDGLQGQGFAITSIEKQYLFTRPDPFRLQPIWCARGRNPDQEPVEFFLGAQSSELLEERRFIFELGILKGTLLGIYPNPDPTDPNYHFATPDNIRLDEAYPVSGARVSGKIAITLTDQNGDFFLVADPPASTMDWLLETGDLSETERTKIGNEIIAYCPADKDAYKPRLRIKYDNGGCAGKSTIGDDDDNKPYPLDTNFSILLNSNASSLMSARLMSFQRLQEFMKAARLVIEGLGLPADDRFPLDVVVADRITNSRFYFSDPEFPKICISYKLTTPYESVDEEQWLTPTLLNHEYAHHIIYSLTQVLQSVSFDCFNKILDPLSCVERSRLDDFDQAPVLEGLTDALAAYYADTPLFGYYDRGSTPGPLAYDLSRIDPRLPSRKRAVTANLLWRIREHFASLEIRPDDIREAKEEANRLLYYWIGLNRVSDGTSHTFDFSFSLLEELLDADDHLFGDGNRLTGTPHDGFLMAAFDGSADLLRVAFVRGDADQSGAIDISDAIYTLRHLFWGEMDLKCIDAMDADDEGQVDISDSIYLLTYLFMGSSPPPAPFPACGRDPTEEDEGFCFKFYVCPLP